MKVNDTPTPAICKTPLESQLLSPHESWRYFANNFEKQVHSLDDDSLRILNQRLDRLQAALQDEQILRLRQLMLAF